MIVSASYRTDIPAFYGDWFLRRLDAGSAEVVNPYGGRVHKVDLSPAAVDGFVFWTRNAAPFMGALAEVARRGFPFVVQYTVTGYPRALETSVVDADRAVAQVRAIAENYGPRAVVWRYDPIVETALTPASWHRDGFARLARALAGAVDEATVSWATIYRKTARNMAAAARAHGFAWRDPADDDKAALLADLAAIAADRGMRLTLCAQPHLLTDAGDRASPPVLPASCIDAARLSDVAGSPIEVRRKGNRPGCECAESRDIGAYDTCPHGCVYCYAVGTRALARRRFKAHDPEIARLDG